MPKESLYPSGILWPAQHMSTLMNSSLPGCPIFPSQHGTLYREMSRDRYLNLLDVGSFQLLNLIALHVYKEGAIYSEVVLRRDSSWLLQEALGLNFYLMYAGSGT